jgi:nitric oxide synthase oxygenase domain/subunit
MSTIEKMLDKLKDNDRKVEQFSDILDSIDSASDKKKMLWKEIYENAIVDRTNAHILFTDLYSNMGGSAADHATLGQTLTKYLERMSKSNEQLLALAKQIAESETSSVEVSEDEIFERIKK